MTIRINTQESILSCSDLSEQVIGCFLSQRGSSIEQTSIKTLKIKYKFDASVLPFIRGDVNRQWGREWVFI